MRGYEDDDFRRIGKMRAVRVKRLLPEAILRAQGLTVRSALLGGPQHGGRWVTAAGGDLGPAEGRSLYPDRVDVT
jgi:hypothetical protein